MKREYIYLIAITAISIGTIIFGAISNRGLRYEIRDLKAENVIKQAAIDSLHTENDQLEKALQDSEEKIAHGTVIYDSLKTTLENLNNQKIVTINAGIRTVSNLDLDGQIKLLSGFLSEADSISR